MSQGILQLAKVSLLASDNCVVDQIFSRYDQLRLGLHDAIVLATQTHRDELAIQQEHKFGSTGLHSETVFSGMGSLLRPSNTKMAERSNKRKNFKDSLQAKEVTKIWIYNILKYLAAERITQKT